MAAADRRMESAWYDEFHIDGCLVKPVLRGDINRALAEAFSAPAVPEVEAPPALADTGSASTDTGASHSSRGRVLVVEDNAVNQLVVVRILQKDGYEVRTAADGREALALFEVEKPDVILMDLQMPNMDGLEATRCLRASEAGRDVPIIALTAHAMAGDREKCLQAGMNAYLSKPVQAEALRRLLAEVLKPETVRAA
jgi:protein-histidine pros-kinase